MTEPSERGKRRAREILSGSCSNESRAVHYLARHLDAEDKAARVAADHYDGSLSPLQFARRHILPDPKPTVRDILQRARRDNLNHDETAQDLRDAGLLKETDCD